MIEHFIKPSSGRAQEQIDDYNLLKEWEEQGLSSMLVEILNYRKKLEANLHHAYSSVVKKLKKEFNHNEFSRSQGRVNYT